MSNSSKITCNGPRVRELRNQRSMTQEKLAAMSNVDLRTVQRAEQNRPVQLETLASIAAALGVTVPEITLRDSEQSELPETSTPVEPNAVVLRRTSSGKAVLDALCSCFSGHLECAAEPTPENVDALTELVEHIERHIPNPWQTPMDADVLTLSQRLREALEIKTKIEALEKFGLATFIGTYTSRAQVPHYDIDEGCMSTRIKQKFEPVKVARISIAPAELDRITVRVSDQWEEPAPQKEPASEPIPIDDEIPF